MVAEQKLRDRKNKILKITHSEKLWQLECASAVLLFFMEDAPLNGDNSFPYTDTQKRMETILLKRDYGLVGFIIAMNREYKIVDKVLDDTGSVIHITADKKKIYNFMIDLISKLRIEDVKG